MPESLRGGDAAVFLSVTFIEFRCLPAEYLLSQVV